MVAADVPADAEVTTATVGLPTRLVLSAVAGMGAATVCHPLDVIRVQMQVLYYRNSWHAFTSIYETAGLRNGLYAGISAAYLRQLLYGSCRMGIYSYLLERDRTYYSTHDEDGGSISLGRKLAIGSIAGAIGSFVGTPSELALVRMTADSKLPPNQQRHYSSVVDCLVRIVRDEGMVQLWRGALPTVLRATALSSAQMGVTSEVKSVLSESGWFGVNGQWLEGYPMMFCATVVGSFCAIVVSTPFDVVKSRLQNMSTTERTPKYAGMMDCMVQSVQAQGVRVLWKGFTPAFIKLAPYSVISLTLLEKMTLAWTGTSAL